MFSLSESHALEPLFLVAHRQGPDYDSAQDLRHPLSRLGRLQAFRLRQRCERSVWGCLALVDLTIVHVVAC